MNKSKAYPDWFINELADEETKIRFLSGAGTVSESVYFRCHNGHPNYKQIVKNHITPNGEPRNICPLCAKERLISKKYPDWFMSDLEYDEDKESIINFKYSSSKKVTFKCIECGGLYTQTLSNHLKSKRMCARCSSKQRGKSYVNTMNLKREPYPKWFIEELVNEEDKKRALSGDLSGSEKVLFRCIDNKEHDNYIQLVRNHIKISTGQPKQGCPMCRYLKSSSNLVECYRKKRKEFPLSIYDDISNESDINLLKSKTLSYNTKVDFICHTCGNTYSQAIKDHLRGKRCPACSSLVSRAEMELRDIVESTYKGEILYNNKDVLGNQELDIYLPHEKIGIEYNGSFWHRTLPEGKGSKDRDYHLKKFISCAKKGIHLISIFDVDIFSKREKIVSFLHDLLSEKNSIYARNCSVERISTKMANAMYSEYHILGSTSNISVSYGLFYNGELISCMSFQKGRYNYNKLPVWCLTRFVTKSSNIVVGGASKLLSKFEKDYSPDILVSYSDNDYFIGNVYKNLGFINLGYVKTPRYYWYLNDKEYKRERCQLKVLSKYYPDIFENSKQIKGNREDFIMLSLGAYKVFRSGNTKWIKNYKEN